MSPPNEKIKPVVADRSVMEVFDPPLPKPIKFSFIALAIALLSGAVALLALAYLIIVRAGC